VAKIVKLAKIVNTVSIVQKAVALAVYANDVSIAN
jgi:hypothetical protein